MGVEEPKIFTFSSSRACSEPFYPCFKNRRDFFSGLDEKANLRGNLAAEVNLVNS